LKKFFPVFAELKTQNGMKKKQGYGLMTEKLPFRVSISENLFRYTDIQLIFTVTYSFSTA